MTVFLSHSAAETEAHARRIAQKVQNGDVLFLEGALGMGKSVFARALIRALCGDAGLEVPSPTFSLLQTYEPAPASPLGPLWHFDLYRITQGQEVFALGWEEALSDGVVIVEWPRRLGEGAPPVPPPRNRLELRFTPAEGESTADTQPRMIAAIPFGHWKERPL